MKILTYLYRLKLRVRGYRQRSWTNILHFEYVWLFVCLFACCFTHISLTWKHAFVSEWTAIDLCSEHLSRGGLYRALRAVTRDLGFFGLIQNIAPYSRLERQARGTEDIIVLTGQIRRISPHSLACNVLQILTGNATV